MSDAAEDAVWLLVKRDLYWRPNSKGYTGIRDEAGRYTLEEASRYADHGDGTTKILAAEAPEFRKATWPDLVAAHLLKQRDARTRRPTVEQISDAPEIVNKNPRDFADAYRLCAEHSGLHPEDAYPLVVAVAAALTAARIEGERLGMERAAKWHDAQVPKARELMDSYGPENDIDGMRHRTAGTRLSAHQGSAAAIRALAKELP